jgi:hypothetical protein
LLVELPATQLPRAARTSLLRMAILVRPPLAGFTPDFFLDPPPKSS